jgi:hypothetical protein
VDGGGCHSRDELAARRLRLEFVKRPIVVEHIKRVVIGGVVKHRLGGL